MLRQSGPRCSAGNSHQWSKDTGEALHQSEVDSGKGGAEEVDGDGAVVEEVGEEAPAFAVGVHFGALDGGEDQRADDRGAVF